MKCVKCRSVTLSFPLKDRKSRAAIWLAKLPIGNQRYLHTGKMERWEGLLSNSRMTRECHVRLCERLRGRFPGATRRVLPTILILSEEPHAVF